MASLSPSLCAWRNCVRPSPLALAVALVIAPLGFSANAAPVGKLDTLRQEGSSIHIHTDSGVLVQLDVLKPSLIRIQAGANGKLSGEGSKAAAIVIKSDYPAVAFTLSDEGDHRLLRTEALALRIYEAPLRFALYQADNQTLITEELQSLELGDTSTVQTLSTDADERFFGGGQQNGAFEFKGKSLEISYSGGWEEGDRPSPAPFYLSSKGYGVLRNTWANGSYDFRSNDALRLGHDEARFDAFFFAPGSIQQVLADYTELTGRARLIPRWAFEYGDADCYNDGDNVKKPGTVPDGWSDGPTGTTPDVIDSVAKKYREHDMPGGWILPNDGYGCGYTDLPRVVEGLAKYGFRTGLWTEDGVDKIAWEVGKAGSRAQKLDVAWTGEGYQHALDANKAAADGILDNSDSRPFLWTVMGWAGVQRYAVTWTGDQSGSWDYIRWHIPTLIGSGLSGQAYATGDVDAIFGGSPETFTRDLQWKAFTPVLMGMSGWSKAARKHPWWFDEPYRSINRDYLKLKMRLTPYMYTTAFETEQTGAPIVRGLMWDYSDDPNANTEAHKYQFLLGKDMLVAPVYRSQTASKGWREDVYLPKGQWIDYWDGRVVDAFDGGKTLDYPVDLSTIPVFVRAGAIIPMYPEALYDGEKPKDVLTLDIYPYGESEYLMYEDDGNTRRYQQGEFARQRFAVKAPEGKGGDIEVSIGAAEGKFDGQDEERVYELWLHTRTKPQAVLLDGKKLKALKDEAALAKAKSGWAYSDTKYGTVLVKTHKVSVREALTIKLEIDESQQLAATAAYPEAPELGNEIPADSLLVLGRPAEEAGHPLENAFDGNPDTWFRTKRDQAQKTGAHEFTLALGERRFIAGFEIAPRNDKHWEYGQVADYELYLGENNGEWGEPVAKGRLEKSQTMQKVEFAPKPGSLLRFRVLSTQNELGNDPMVTAARKQGGAYNALLPKSVTPITISDFKVLTAPEPKTPRTQLFLAELTPQQQDKSAGSRVALNSAIGGKPMSMNGLKFSKGLGMAANGRVDYRLEGNWQLLRADLGIDDSCKTRGGMHFKIFGDGKLMYDSGLIEAPAVVKPELDIRGVETLSLQTEGTAKGVCGNWANASVLGWPKG
ncbi:NPCBM/NEW2 domain-containing protein [Shewanella litorisediminis]|uniref:NPCBM/NEW2 domain-containing protein n=1 Tax=Shewanella litorisediminis TaxID=1173586 RepID=A0ABX7G426_9GAMM|nr:NPCBM/NEW2 domain-containing protein [Shewanella litorisediminis]MCL2919385.1 NPCBM/NEW2 domain-containing protein [Shewanella litorisediminis]QRH02000.1 NPCBM/NEW2 domain-containing protein [Shewanella litorisediminis]